MLEPGATAPDFDLPATTGERVSLSGLRGKPVVLVFIPFAFTGICEGELCQIRDDPSAFATPDAQLAVVTCDSSPTQKQWAQEQGFTFPLLADFWPHGEVARAYGVFNDALGCAMRATFVIDAEGTVKAAFQTAGLREPRTKDAYQAALASL